MDPTSGHQATNLSDCMDYYHQVDMCSWEFIMKTIVLSIITVAILLGNSLVITAVFLYQKLRKSVSNFFIASLAAADLTLAIVVLPFSLLLVIMKYWMVGDVMCQIWLVTDVWVCTASILHLCAISVDRYIAIAYPLRYPNIMTRRRCKLICFAMWISSFIICFPGLLNWEPHKVRNVTVSEDEPPSCDVISSNSPGYVIYSAMGSFFIPCIIMSGFYIKIFLLAHKFMEQSKSGTIASDTANGNSLRVHRGGGTGSTSIPPLSYERHRLLTPNHVGESNVDNEELDNKTTGETDNSSRQSSFQSRTTSTIDRKLLSGFVGRRSSKLNVGHTMNKETRAAKTVAIIVGCFILCWTPFFICYVIQGVSRIQFEQSLFTFFIWVGYINSLFNPCIYAYFSTDYRHAFEKILRCQVKSSISRRQGLMRYLGSLYVSSSSSRNHERSLALPQQQQVLKPPDSISR